MKTSLPPSAVRQAVSALSSQSAPLHRRPAGAQPVHTVYGGAHRFNAGTLRKLGAMALAAFETDAPDPDSLVEGVGMNFPDDTPLLPGNSSRPRLLLHQRIAEKLRTEPIEDYRVDFEDGYGLRAPAEEDGHAVSAGREAGRAQRAGDLPRSFGIRIRGLAAGTAERAFRTLDLFLTALLEESGGTLPGGFVVTLPKVARLEEVECLVDVLGSLEPGLGLARGAIDLEVMVEAPALLVGPDGCLLPRLVPTSAGRLRGVHFGAFDYLAALGIPAHEQHLLHPACDEVRHAMLAAFAGTGLWLSDGVTALMPVGPHRTGTAQSAAQQAANRRAVHRAWRLHYRHVRHAVSFGIFQGWDLHPAQIPARLAALYAALVPHLPDAGARLRALIASAGQAIRAGDMFDDVASGQGLVTVFARALTCGAISPGEAAAATGVDADRLREGSFERLLSEGAPS